MSLKEKFLSMYVGEERKDLEKLLENDEYIPCSWSNWLGIHYAALIASIILSLGKDRIVVSKPIQRTVLLSKGPLADGSWELLVHNREKYNDS